MLDNPDKRRAFRKGKTYEVNAPQDVGKQQREKILFAFR